MRLLSPVTIGVAVGTMLIACGCGTSPKQQQNLSAPTSNEYVMFANALDQGPLQAYRVESNGSLLAVQGTQASFGQFVTLMDGPSDGTDFVVGTEADATFSGSLPSDSAVILEHASTNGVVSQSSTLSYPGAAVYVVAPTAAHDQYFGEYDSTKGAVVLSWRTVNESLVETSRIELNGMQGLLATDSSGRSLYFYDFQAGTLHSFPVSVDGVIGAEAAQMPVSVPGTAQQVQATNDGKWVWLSGQDGDKIQVLDATTLQPVPGSPFSSGITGATCTNRQPWLVCVGNGQISVLTFQNGQISQTGVTQVSIGGGAPVVTQSGFVYVGNWGLSGYKLDLVNGGLAVLPGSPFQSGGATAGPIYKHF